jgi:hypothetical protein
VDVILQEMKKANDIPNSITGKMITRALFRKKISEEVQPLGLMFWKEFIAHQKDEKYLPAPKTIRHLDNHREDHLNRNDEILPKTFLLDSCYIHTIKYHDEVTPYIKVELITTLDFRTVSLNVYMPFDTFITLLQKATNTSVSSAIRSMLYENINHHTEEYDKILVREWYKTYLYCKGIDLTLVKCSLSDNGIPISHHCYYQTVDFDDWG